MKRNLGIKRINSVPAELIEIKTAGKWTPVEEALCYMTSTGGMEVVAHDAVLLREPADWRWKLPETKPSQVKISAVGSVVPGTDLSVVGRRIAEVLCDVANPSRCDFGLLTVGGVEVIE